MKRMACATAVLLLAACTSSAPQAASGIVGHYLLHIEARDNPPWRDLIGDFDFYFRDNGELHIEERGKWSVEARYRLDGDLLLINDSSGDSACRANGVDRASGLFRVHFTNTGMQLQPLRDECRARRVSMTLVPMRRIE